MTDDRKWMAEALRLAEAARGQSAPNPNVGCVIVSSSGRVVGKAATAAGGRPHAEAAALDQAGRRAKGATVYVTLEPCAHRSERGPCCTDLLLAAKPARVVIALKDPDPRTSGKGIQRLRRVSPSGQEPRPEAWGLRAQGSGRAQHLRGARSGQVLLRGPVAGLQLLEAARREIHV